MRDVVVKESKIEGRGVFANKNFKKGETVIRWDASHQLSPDEATEVSGKKYLAYVGGKIMVQQSPAKYVNHSCNPNTKVKGFCDVAIRDIKKGEEITSDYSIGLGPERMECNCASKNCKGTITGKNQNV